MRPWCRKVANYIAFIVFWGATFPIVGYATGALHLARWTVLTPETPPIALQTAIFVALLALAMWLITFNGTEVKRAKDEGPFVRVPVE